MKAKIINIFNRCENITGWSSGSCVLSIDSTDKYEGKYSFKVNSNDNTWGVIWYAPDVDWSMYSHVSFYVYHPGWTNETGKLQITTDAANYATWIFDFAASWTQIKLDLSAPDSEEGTLDLSDIHSIVLSETNEETPGENYYYDYIQVYKDVESKVSECKVLSPTARVPYRRCNMIISPNDEAYLQNKDTIIIKDDDEEIAFAGKIYEKTDMGAYYRIKARGWDHEFRTAMYQTAYSANKSSEKLEGQIDKSNFTYYSSSIEATTTDYTYDIKKNNNYMLAFFRWMERGVYYSVMEESECKAYFRKAITDVNSLVDSGETWVEGTDTIKYVRKHDLDIGLTRVAIFGGVNSKGQVYYIASSAAPEQEEGIMPTYPFTDSAIMNYTEAKQFGDNILAIFGTSQLFIELIVEGKGFLQPWKRVNYANASVSLSADDYAIVEWVYDAKGDVYDRFIISNGIAYNEEFRAIQKQMMFRDDVINAEFINSSAVVMTEDGTVIPGARHDKSVWRAPEPTSIDLREGGGNTDFSTIGDVALTWYDIDLSAFIPVGTTSIFVKVFITDNAVGTKLNFRKNGQTSTFQILDARVTVANVATPYYFPIGVDSDRKIEFRASPKASDIDGIEFTILDWRI